MAQSTFPHLQWLKHIPEQQLQMIVQQANGDARRLINMITFLSANSQGNIIATAQKMSCDSTLQIFEATKQMLYMGYPMENKLAIKISDTYYKQDPFMMEGMFHENYPVAVEQRLHAFQKQMPLAIPLTMNTISSYMSDGDRMHCAEDTHVASRSYSYYSVSWPMPNRIPQMKFTKLPGHISSSTKMKHSAIKNEYLQVIQEYLFSMPSRKDSKSEKVTKCMEMLKEYYISKQDLQQIEKTTKKKIPKWIYDQVDEFHKHRAEYTCYAEDKIVPDLRSIVL
jgi:DNA polymerase III delta prime subunit